MRLSIATLLAVLTGCAPTFQQVQIVEPANAKVEILEGVTTKAVETTAPFVANFEACSLKDWAAYTLKFELDDQTAKRFGGNSSVTLYGRLVVGEPTKVSEHQTVMVQMPVEKIKALIAGSSVEIEVHVTDPNARPPRELARLTLRAAPF